MRGFTVLQNQAAFKRAKYNNLKTNQTVSHLRKNNLVFDLQKINLRIGFLMKF